MMVKYLLRKDVNKLLEQLNNIAIQTNYNGTNLLQAKEVCTWNKRFITSVGENRGDLIKTKTIQSNTTGSKLTTLKKL